MNKINQPLKVALLGEFNAGKTTLINAMLDSNCFKVGILPTTMIPTQIAYSDIDLLKIEDAQQNVSYHDVAQLDHYQHQTAKDENMAIKSLTMMLKKDFLKEVILFDTPGFAATYEIDQVKTKAILSEMDAFVWVISIEQLVTNQQLQLIKSLSTIIKGRSICLINKYDLLNEKDDIQKASHSIHETLKGYFDHFYVVSGHQGMKKRKQDVDQINQIKSFILQQKSNWIKSSEQYRINLKTEEKQKQKNQEKLNLEKVKNQIALQKNDLKIDLQNLNIEINKVYQNLLAQYKKLEEQTVNHLSQNVEYYYITVEKPGWFSSDVDYKARVALSTSYIQQTNPYLFKEYENLLNQYISQLKEIFSKFIDKRNQFYNQQIAQHSILNFLDHSSLKEQFNFNQFFEKWKITNQGYLLAIQVSKASSNLFSCADKITLGNIKRREFSSTRVLDAFKTSTIFENLHKEIYKDIQQFNTQATNENQEIINKIEQRINQSL